MIKFSILIGMFAVPFGIALESNMSFVKKDDSQDNYDFYFKKFQSIFDFTFWPIFGEIEKALEKLDSQKICNASVSVNSDKCVREVPLVASYLFLMTYMMTSSLLLINLLIAIFRYLIIYLI